MEHPAITRTLRTGYPNGEPTYPLCPICGAECEEVHKDRNGVVFGCNECVNTHSAWEVEECFKRC